MIFEEKYFRVYIFIIWPTFNVWLPLLCEILGNIYCNCLVTRLWRQKFWKWLYLLNKAFSSTWTKSQDKNLNILRTKRAFKMKQKTFCIIFKGLSLKQITIIFLGRWEFDFKACHSQILFGRLGILFQIMFWNVLYRTICKKLPHLKAGTLFAYLLTKFILNDYNW